MQTTKLKKKGFTLVELVIVVAVIAVLSAILVPTIGCVVEDAKETNDMATVRLLNVALAEDQAENDKPATMTDALAAMERKGYLIDKLTPRSSGEILWDSENNRFVLYKDGTPLDTSTTATDKVNLWKIVDNISELANGGYSYYLKGDSISGDIGTITTGLDVGKNTGITTIKYENNATAQDVVIRTNSIKTVLTIDDKTDGKVYHYDELGKLVVTECGYACYYECGSTVYAKATKGKIVAKEGGEISILYATANTVAAQVDGGTISEAYCVSNATDETGAAGYTNSSNAKGGNVTFIYAKEDGTELSATEISSAGELAIAAETGELPEDLKEAGYVAVVNKKGYTDLVEAIANAPTNATISLLNNVTITNSATANLATAGSMVYNVAGTRTCNVAIMVNKNLTINGNGYTLTTVDARNYSSSIGINSNVTLVINDLDILNSCMSNIFVGENSSNASIELNNVYLEGGKNCYCIKTCAGADNLTININDSEINGWNSLNCRSNNSVITIKNTNLRGTNKAGESRSNDYATLVLDGDSVNHHEYGRNGSNNTLIIINSIVTSTSESSNKQQWLSVQYGSINNTVTVDALSIINPETKWSFSRTDVTNQTYDSGTTVTINGVAIECVISAS